MYEPVATATPVWMAYMPKFVWLYCVGNDSSFDEYHNLLQRCIQDNSYAPLNENVFDYWDFPEGEYLDEIRRKMWEDGFLDEYEEAVDEIREYLWEHDESNPVEDLLNNTSYLHMFYSLGVSLDHGYNYGLMGTWRNQSCAQSAYRIRQILGIKKGTPEDEKILELCENSTYGGELRIYFEAPINNLITNGDDWKSIKFKGTFRVAVWDNCNGSGDFVDLELDKEFPFIRENLQISDVAESYDIETVCGLCGDWLRDYDTPSFSDKKPSKLTRIKKSETLTKEQHFQKVFNEGRCSIDDTVMSRHRGVYYRNEYPCGWVCPNCGKVWYD